MELLFTDLFYAEALKSKQYTEMTFLLLLSTHITELFDGLERKSSTLHFFVIFYIYISQLKAFF